MGGNGFYQKKPCKIKDGEQHLTDTEEEDPSDDDLL